MKTLALLFILAAASAQAQTVITIPVPENTTRYDSLVNIPDENTRSMVGQTVLVLHKPALYKSPNLFSLPCDSTVISKKYDVVKLGKNEKRRQIYLLLASGTDTVYYRLSENTIENPSIITLGYFSKQTKLHTGKTFKLKLPANAVEINTGETLKLNTGEVFTCTGSAIINGLPSFILNSKSGKQIAVPLPGFETDTDNSTGLFNII